MLLFNPTRARWVSRETWHPKQDGKLQLDGSYLLKFPYSREPELVMDILKYGGRRRGAGAGVAAHGRGGATARRCSTLPLSYFLASTPSPRNSVVKPAARRRRATSFGTSRPLVSLLGVPV